MRNDSKIKLFLIHLLHKLFISQKVHIKLRHLHYSGIYYTIGEADRSTFTPLRTKSVHCKATIHNIMDISVDLFLKYTLKCVTLEEREKEREKKKKFTSTFTTNNSSVKGGKHGRTR